MIGRFLAAVRSAWLVIGSGLLILVALEGLYRAQAAFRTGLTPATAASPPGWAAEGWFPELAREAVATQKMVWKPYVYYRREPFNGHYITVDSSNHRRTVQPATSGEPRRIFMFGGSTMFGTLQRDEATIPSLLARTLSDQGTVGVELTNFGESGYVFTQEVLQLILELRAGARPDVVVFYDGINDAFSAIQNSVSGVPQNEGSRARDFALGRIFFPPVGSLGGDLKAVSYAAGMSFQHLRFVERIRQLIPASGGPPPSARDLAAQVLQTYVGTVGVVEALGRAYGFRTLYIWQPALHATNKPVTPAERAMLNTIATDPFASRLAALHSAIRASIDSAMLGVAEGRFLNFTTAFVGESAQVYIDLIGHTTERANARIVQLLAPAVIRLLPNTPPDRKSRKTA